MSNQTYDSSSMKKHNEQLLNILENAKFERDTSVVELQNFKMKYESLVASHTKLQNELVKQRLQSQKDNEARIFAERKFKEQFASILTNEKKLSGAINQAERLEHEAALYKSQMQHFQIVYDEMEQRKNAEIKFLTNELTTIRNNYHDLKLKNETNEDALSEMKFNNTKLTQDLNVKKTDCDSLTKIIEDSNLTVKSAQEKEKHYDSLAKSYQKRIDDLTLEQEKSKIKIQMQLNQLTKLNDDYNKIVQEKTDNFDSTLQSNKNKYEEIFGEINDELSMTKGEMVSMKIERDKYFSEYTILRKEVERMNEALREENQKYMQKCEENDQNVNRLQIHFQDKMRLLVIRNDALEKDNKDLSDRLTEYIRQEEARNDLLSRMNQNEDDLTKETIRMKEAYEQTEKQRKELEKQYTRLLVKYKQLEDLSDMRVNALESTLKIKKGQCDIIENKVYELMKTQQEITGKMKDEYLSFTIKENVF